MISSPGSRCDVAVKSPRRCCVIVPPPLTMITKNWVKELTRFRGYTDQMVEDANAIIFTFGSYRLGTTAMNVVMDLVVKEKLALEQRGISLSELHTSHEASSFSPVEPSLSSPKQSF